MMSFIVGKTKSDSELLCIVRRLQFLIHSLDGSRPHLVKVKINKKPVRPYNFITEKVRDMASMVRLP